MFSAMEVSSRAVEHRLDKLYPVIPQHGCIPAEPASASPGEVILTVLEEWARATLRHGPAAAADAVPRACGRVRRETLHSVAIKRDGCTMVPF
jgi:hypothetical protein